MPLAKQGPAFPKPKYRGASARYFGHFVYVNAGVPERAMVTRDR